MVHPLVELDSLVSVARRPRRILRRIANRPYRLVVISPVGAMGTSFPYGARNRLRRSSIILLRCPCSYALRNRSELPYRCGVVFAADKRDVRKTGPNHSMQLTATRRMFTFLDD
jgi:hypothetical protein